MGERCKLPHRGLGRSPRSQRFFALENAPKVRKKLRIQPLLIANTRCADHDLNIRSTELTVHLSTQSDFLLANETSARARIN